jgi:hypothetical protein
LVRSTTPIRPGLSLSAGPLRVRFDRGELRYFSTEDREVLRGVHAAIRGPAWQTVPPRISALRIEQQSDRFHVTFDARHEDGPLRFAWKARIEGQADGTISFLLDGRAEASFLKNRVGLCVLHPLAGCAGGAVEIEHGDGRVERGVFPDLVSPHQPFLDIRAVRHPLPDGRALEVRFEGEWFEMEDQRNWSDASFKTYSTPLSRPFPARMEAGDTVRHEVTVGLREAPAGLLAVPRAPSARWPEGPFGGAGLQVGLDLGLLQAGPADTEVERLRALRPDHLRIGLGPDAAWGEALARAAELARACGTRLEVAALVTDEGDLGRLAETAAGLPVGAFLLFRHDTRRSDPALLGRARETLGRAVPEARLGGGAAGPFVEVNRHREAAQGVDLLAFELCPQHHARDEATILDNLESLPDVARTAAALAPGVELRLSLARLGPRGEPVDPRLAGPLGGDWVRGLLASAEEAGFSALTLAEAFGPGGILSFDTPAYRALVERPRAVAPLRRP